LIQSNSFLFSHPSMFFFFPFCIRFEIALGSSNFLSSNYLKLPPFPSIPLFSPGVLLFFSLLCPADYDLGLSLLHTGEKSTASPPLFCTTSPNSSVFLPSPHHPFLPLLPHSIGRKMSLPPSSPTQTHTIFLFHRTRMSPPSPDPPLPRRRKN